MRNSHRFRRSKPSRRSYPLLGLAQENAALVNCGSIRRRGVSMRVIREDVKGSTFSCWQAILEEAGKEDLQQV